MPEDKKYVLFYPGPLHHFFFIPISILWSLLKANQVILILDRSYEEDSLFKKIKELPGVKEIIFIKENNTVRNYLDLKKEFSFILKKYQFSTVYIHNPSYVPSYSLALLSKEYQPTARRVYFQTARGVVSYEKEASVKLNVLINNFKFKFLPFLFKRYLILLFIKFKYFIVFKLIPLLVFRRFFYPWVNPHYPKKSHLNGFIKEGFCRDDQDQTIFFDDKTIYHLEEFFPEARFNLQELPLQESYKEIYFYFFDSEVKNIPTISIFPTWGNFKDDLFEKWNSTISTFRDMYPDHKIQIKFHPGVEDYETEKMFKKIESNFLNFKILPKDTPAFKMVVESEVILGDTTTVLWFATNYQEKKVVSLDLFNLKDGDCLKLYSDKLFYIDDIKKINLIKDN